MFKYSQTILFLLTNSNLNYIITTFASILITKIIYFNNKQSIIIFLWYKNYIIRLLAFIIYFISKWSLNTFVWIYARQE